MAWKMWPLAPFSVHHKFYGNFQSINPYGCTDHLLRERERRDGKSHVVVKGRTCGCDDEEKENDSHLAYPNDYYYNSVW